MWVYIFVKSWGPSLTMFSSTRDRADRCAGLVQIQGTNIRHYYTYLLARSKAYKDTRIDWVREGPTRLKRQTIDKGLLRETEAVQGQISKLLQCDVGPICSDLGSLVEEY